MPLPFTSRRITGIRHFSAISWILVKHGLGEIFARLFSRNRAKIKSGLPDPARIRRALEDLGPSFIKLGQLMSIRGDIFPPEYIDELIKLQDQVPPVPFDNIRQMIEADLRRPLDQLFDKIEPDCIAAASVAQVHIAHLNDSSNSTILIVDDEPINRQIVKNHLSIYHYNIIECASGEAALDHLKSHAAQLILLDVMMPQMDGFEVCARIREQHSQLDLPIIYLTARNQVTDLVQGFRSGGNDYLIKPFSKNELLSRIQNQFSIYKVKERMVKLTAYSNEIGEFVNIQILIQKLCAYLTADSCFKYAGGFYEDELIDCRPSDSKKLKQAYHQWDRKKELLYMQQACYIFVELNNYVIAIQADGNISAIDHVYAKSLIAQTQIMHQNIQKLVSDPKVLQDLSYISTHMKRISSIRITDGYVTAYNGNKSHILNLSLKNLKIFFDDSAFLQISRTCLVKSSAITGIIKKIREKKKTCLLYSPE